MLRPDATTVLRNDSYDRNVSLRVHDRTLVVTDESGDLHPFRLGKQRGQVASLDACTWTKEQGPDTARREDDYLVGVDPDQTAVFAITSLGRWNFTDLMTWADVHGLRLSRSMDMVREPPAEAARYVPKAGPRTLVIGRHRRTYMHVLFMIVWWTLAILWGAVTVALNYSSSRDPGSTWQFEIPYWVIVLPLLVAAVASYVVFRGKWRG